MEILPYGGGGGANVWLKCYKTMQLENTLGTKTTGYTEDMGILYPRQS